MEDIWKKRCTQLTEHLDKKTKEIKHLKREIKKLEHQLKDPESIQLIAENNRLKEQLHTAWQDNLRLIHEI